MGNWLNPVTDFLAAAKSGSDVGLSLAKIRNDRQQASSALQQSAMANADQNALGYAKIGADQQQSEANQELAAAKLAESQAQNMALQDYRDRSLDQKGTAADALNQIRNENLSLSKDKFDLSKTNSESLNAFRTKRAAQHQGYLDYLSSNKKVNPLDLASYHAALQKQIAASKALTTPFSDAQTQAAATQQWADSDKEIEAIRSKYGINDQGAPTSGTGTTGATPFGGSAADALTAPSGFGSTISSTQAMPVDNSSLFPQEQAQEVKRIPVISPKGKTGSIPEDQLDDAIKEGYVRQ